jgi:hypothetical protein
VGTDEDGGAVDASGCADGGRADGASASSGPTDAGESREDGGTLTPSPSGAPIPSSDLPGWKLIFADDFLVDAPLGGFPGAAYVNSWTAYPNGWHDTSGNGVYSPARTLSVSDGVLIIDVHTENGVHYVSAPEPMKGIGHLYGRYSVRFRATQMTADYKTAWLLWPDSERWPAGGEIDFPEANLNASFNAFAHYANPAGGQDAFSSNGATYADWHTATIEWSPGRVTFLLDGTRLGSSVTDVPSTPMHWVLQTETNLDGVAPSALSVGRLEIDWVAVWSWQ